MLFDSCADQRGMNSSLLPTQDTKHQVEHKKRSNDYKRVVINPEIVAVPVIGVERLRRGKYHLQARNNSDYNPSNIFSRTWLVESWHVTQKRPLVISR